MKIRNFCLLLISLLISTWAAQAQKTITLVNKLDKVNIQQGAKIQVFDDFELFSGIPNSGYELTKKINVRLNYTRKLQTDLSSQPDWEYTVKYRLIDLTSNTHHHGEVSVSFGNGSKAGRYVDLESYKLSYQRITLEVLEVKATHNGAIVSNPWSSSKIPSDIVLTAEVEEDQHTVLSSGAAIQLKWDASRNLISWGYVNGAEAYDIEWVFIDQKDTKYSTITTATAAFDYKQGVRIQTPFNFYELDPIYPEGKLFVRVRAVGAFVKNTGNDYSLPKMGNWYSTNVVGGGDFTLFFKNIVTPSNHDVPAFEAGKNWTFQKSFIEGGKQKAVVSYFDGSLRSRQVNTKLSTDQTILTGEFYYDAEGRQALNVLPVPNVDASDLKYHSKFNKESDGSTIQAQDYAGSTNFKLSTSTGAGKYYSPYNGYTGDEKAFIPDAEGYPFVVTQYQRDGRSRTSKVSGAGKAFRMGSGKESAIDYPDVQDRDLRKLFGKNAGEWAHYRKIISTDPNGQLTTTIQDLSGKTVASYLSGKKPANLLQLDGITPKTERINIGTTENYVPVNNKVKTSDAIFVEQANTNYTFVFKSFTGSIFQHQFMSTTFCEYCEYDVRLWIEDPDGNRVDVELSNGSSVDEFKATLPSVGQNLANPLSVQNSTDIVATCSGSSAPYIVSDLDELKVTFYKKGTYRIHREISISDKGVQAKWKALLVAKKTALEAKYQQFLTQETDSLDLSGCENWCKQNPAECDKIGKGGTSTLISTGDGENDDLIDYASATCNAYYNQMLNDVAFVNGTEGNEFKRNAFWQRVTNALNASGNNDIHGFTVTQLKDTNTWKNSAHAHLHDAWKAELVKSHREYCLYQDCISKDQKKWQNKRLQMQYITDWDMAKDSGLLYPVSNTIPSGITSPTGPGLLSGSSASGFPSPYTNQFLDGGLSSAERARIAFYMQNFAKSPAVPSLNILANSVVTLFQYLSPTYQNVVGGPVGAGGIYAGLTTVQVKKRQWEYFLRYYTDIRKRVHFKAIVDNCPTISIDELNDANEGCVFPPTPKHNPSANYFVDLTNTNSNPSQFLNNHTGGAFGNLYTQAGNTFPSNFGCSELKENSVKRWMSELAHYCPALTNAQRTTIEARLKTYFDSQCGSQNNPTGVITGIIVENPGTSGPIYDIQQILTSAGCSTALKELVEPTWNGALSSLQPCGGENIMVDLYKTIHNYRFNATSGAPGEVIDYSLAIPGVSQIYDHFGGFAGNYTSPGNNIPQGPFLKLYAHNNWKFIEWSQSCKDGSGNYLLNNSQYFTHTAPSQNANCGSVKTGCIVWALYDSTGNIVDAYGGIAGTIDPIHFKSKLEIKRIDYYPNLPTSLQNNMPSKPVINISGVRSSNGADFIYRKLRIVYEATLLDGTKQERYAYVFGDKNCLSGDCYTKEDPCAVALKAGAVSAAQSRYMDYLADLQEKFLDSYYSNCAKYLKDNLYYDQTIEDGYYTLYYYDQAGNLVQTVPPKGVDVLDNSAFDNTGAWNGTSQPNHNYTTKYRYNGLNQVLEQNTPDAGKTRFYYNVKSQIRLSQNSQQAVMKKIVGGVNYYAFSYSEYDALGRVKAAGQLWASLTKANADFLMYNLTKKEQKELLKNVTLTKIGSDYTISGNYRWRVYGKEQMVRTYYGDEVTSVPTCPISRDNTRSRVVASTFKHDLILATPQVNDYDAASHYSYDVLGNVKTLLQESKLLAKHGYSANQNFKRIDYEYDYISGNVLKVAYQRGEVDQFFHKYEYDEDNRIRAAYTSKDEMIWDRDAKYKYYKHGPLQRVELGEDKVQGQDMAYTLQGWLKGTNSTLLSPEKDMAKDGIDKSSHLHKWTARDAYGYTLGYYADDYKGIGNTQGFLAKANPLFVNHQRALYNGNIAYMTTAFMDLEEGLSKPVTAYAFKYDRLNRFKSSMDYNGKDLYGNGNNDWTNAPQAALNYVPKVVYDPNGNIKELVRYADKGGVGTKMDDFSYKYLDETGADANNKLGYVTDAVADGVFTGIDLDNQSANNYAYDNIGNLIKDDKESIQEIRWTVSGKVKEIIKKKDVNNLKEDIEFVYDASGNRIAKIVKPHLAASAGDIAKMDGWITTHYVRDASGNVMATYTDKSGMYAEVEKYPFVVFRVVGHTGHAHLTTSNGQTIVNAPISGASTAEVAAAQLVTAIAAVSGTPFQAVATHDVVRVYYKNGAPFSSAVALVIGQNTLPIEMITDKTFKAGSNVPGSTTSYKQLVLNEHHIYGSSRLGMKSKKQPVASTFFQINQDQGEYNIEAINTQYEEPLYASATKNTFDRTVAQKQYELANHLGNVNAVISDKKLLKSDGSKRFVKNTDFTTWGSFHQNWAGNDVELIQENGRIKIKSTKQWAGLEHVLQTTKGRVYRVSFDLDLGTTSKVALVCSDISAGINYSNINCTSSGYYEFLFATYSNKASLRFERADVTNATAKSFYLDNLMVEEMEITNEQEEVGLPESKWVISQNLGGIGVQNNPGSFTWTFTHLHDRKMRKMGTEVDAYYAVKAKVSSLTNGKFFFTIWDNVNGAGRKWQNIGNGAGDYIVPFKAISKENSFVIFNNDTTGLTNKIKVEGAQLIKLKRRGMIVEESFDDFDGWKEDHAGKGKLSIEGNRLRVDIKDVTSQNHTWRAIHKPIKTTPGKYYRIKLDADLGGLAGNAQNHMVISADDKYGPFHTGIKVTAEGGAIFQAREKLTDLFIGVIFYRNDTSIAETRTFYIDNIEIAEMDKVPGTTQLIDNTGWTITNAASSFTQQAGSSTKLNITAANNWHGVQKNISGFLTKGKYYTVEPVITKQIAGKRIGSYLDEGSAFPKHYKNFHSNADQSLPVTFYSHDGEGYLKFFGREVGQQVVFSVDHIQLKELRKGKVISRSDFDKDYYSDHIVEYYRPGRVLLRKGANVQLSNENGKLKVNVDTNWHGVERRIHTIPGKYYKLKYDVDFNLPSGARFINTIWDDFGPVHMVTQIDGIKEVLFRARKTITTFNLEIIDFPSGVNWIDFLLDNVKITEMMPVPNSRQNITSTGWTGYLGGSISSHPGGIKVNVPALAKGAQKDITNLVSAGHFYVINANFNTTFTGKRIGVDILYADGSRYDQHFEHTLLHQGAAFKADTGTMTMVLNGRTDTIYNFTAEDIHLIQLQEDRLIDFYDFDLTQKSYTQWNAGRVHYDATAKQIKVKTPARWAGVMQTIKTEPGKEYLLSFDAEIPTGKTFNTALVAFEQKNVTNGTWWKLEGVKEISGNKHHTMRFKAKRDHTVIVWERTDTITDALAYLKLRDVHVQALEPVYKFNDFEDVNGFSGMNSPTLSLEYGGKLKVSVTNRYAGTKYYFDTEIGKQYTVRYDLGQGTVSTITTAIRNGSTYQNYLVEDVTASKTIVHTFTAQSEKSIVIIEKKDNNQLTQYFTVDNFVVEKSGSFKGYFADVVSFSDYYPFGMEMLNRNGNSGDYRYGFQGQETDDEVKSSGNSVNFKYRMHDARIGRFFAVDPLTFRYPHYSPFAFSGNRLIDAREIEGLEPEILNSYARIFSRLFVHNLALKIERMNDVAWRTTRIKAKLTGKATALDLVSSYSMAFKRELGGYTAMEGISVVTEGRTASGEKATYIDYIAAPFDIVPEGGFLVKSAIKTVGAVITVGAGLRKIFTYAQRSKVLKSGGWISDDGSRLFNRFGTDITDLKKVNGRFPVNGLEYAGGTKYFSGDLAKRYPNGVKYSKEGFPDFSPYILLDDFGDPIKVDLGVLGKNRQADFRAGEKIMRKKFPGWTQPDNTTWHHVEGSAEMILLPFDVHNAAKHTGGVAGR